MQIVFEDAAGCVNRGLVELHEDKSNRNRSEQLEVVRIPGVLNGCHSTKEQDVIERQSRL